MDYRFTLSVLGRLTFGYGLCMLIPGFLSLYHGEAAWQALFLSAFISIVLGWGMTFLRRDSHHLGIREGFAIVGGGWLLASFLGALP